MTREMLVSKSKITKVTVRSFIKDLDGLYIRIKSAFDGMTDGVESVVMCPVLAVPTDLNLENTFGVHGAWFVVSTKNFCSFVENEEFYGISVSNCCGSFELLRKRR